MMSLHFILRPQSAMISVVLTMCSCDFVSCVQHSHHERSKYLIVDDHTPCKMHSVYFFLDAGMKSNFSFIHNLAIKLGISKAYPVNITIQLGKRQIIRSFEKSRCDCTGKHTCTTHALCDCVHVIQCICL